MIDEYCHSDPTIFYISENIPGPVDTIEDNELKLEFESQLLSHCECILNCTSGVCKCLNSFMEFSEDKLKYRLKVDKSSSACALIECNDLCSCSDSCVNRLVQKGPINCLVVKQCKNALKGLGVFTEQPIYKGTFICEYAGEVITQLEAEKRHKENIIAGRMNYILCVKEHSATNSTQTFVDPSKFGNIGRYINHSCKPNCVIIPVRVNSPIPKLAIFSSTDIIVNQELTFDYGSSNCNKINVNMKKICLCNESVCVGYMPFENY